MIVRSIPFLIAEILKRAGVLWKYTSVADILGNEVYIGNLVQGKYGSVSYKTRQCTPRPKEKWIRVEGTHEPIIDQSLWETAQRKIRSHTRPNKKTGMIHLFSGIAVCMHCGYYVRMHRGHGNYYLQCETRQISDAACPGAFMPEAELERVVLKELRKLNNQLLDMGDLQREINFEAAMNAQKAKLLSEQQGYRDKVAEFDFTMKQLYIDKTKGLVSTTDYFKMTEGFQEDRARFDALANALQDKIDDIDLRIQIGDNRVELLSQYNHAEHLTRKMVELLIDRIEIGKRDKETKQVPVTIHWNF